MKILVTSCGHIRDQPRRELLRMWVKCVEQYATFADVLYIDSNSPIDVTDTLSPSGFQNLGVIDDDSPIDLSNRGRFMCRFDNDAWRHRSNEGGRAVRKGLQTALDNGYDWVFYWESDALLAVDVIREIRKFQRIGIKVAMPWCIEYNYPETQFCLYDCKYLRETNFVETYDWQHAIFGIDELRRERAHANELVILPWRGRHNNTGWVNRDNFDAVARLSDGTSKMDWISHCEDQELYKKFLRLNGVRM